MIWNKCPVRVGFVYRKLNENDLVHVKQKIYTCIHKKKGLLDVNIMSLMKRLDGLQTLPFTI